MFLISKSWLPNKTKCQVERETTEISSYIVIWHGNTICNPDVVGANLYYWVIAS